MALNFHHDGRTGYVELNNPPVNAINAAMRQGLLDAVRSAEKLNLERVIVSGLGRALRRAQMPRNLMVIRLNHTCQMY